MSSQMRDVRAQMEEDENLKVLMQSLRGSNLSDADFAGGRLARVAGWLNVVGDCLLVVRGWEVMGLQGWRSSCCSARPWLQERQQDV